MESRMHSYHMVDTDWTTGLRHLLRPPSPGEVSGLGHAETMARMDLGAPVLTPKRFQPQRFSMFASWESESALDNFLHSHPLGQVLETGWHARLDFIRRWGSAAEFADLPEQAREVPPETPVIAVTLARLKLPELGRFIRWGRPVERLVRDHPGAAFALAGVRPPRTFSTFSIWKSQREMIQMVSGDGDGTEARSHVLAMQERARKSFHHQFTTLRFTLISEHGSIQGRTRLVPWTP